MIYADWFARRFKFSTTVVILPCVMILVPGLAALQALHLATTEGALPGFRAGSHVLVLITAIIGGSLVGDALTLHNIVKTGKAVASIITHPTTLGREGKDRNK